MSTTVPWRVWKKIGPGNEGDVNQRPRHSRWEMPAPRRACARLAARLFAWLASITLATVWTLPITRIGPNGTLFSRAKRTVSANIASIVPTRPVSIRRRLKAVRVERSGGA
mgnify:CR=1 FL=1